jgi:DNA-binding GntR family transcriptional regulator
MEITNVLLDDGSARSRADAVDRRLEKLSSMALRERVYAQLGNAIRAGRFEPGEVLTIRGLAETLGTSTMPVREAVNRLITERALEMLPHGRMRIPQLTLERLKELTDVRATLEGRAAALACENMTPARFTAIRSANERFVSAIESMDRRAAVEANEALHFELYSAAGSALLLSLIEGLWLQSGPYLAAMMNAVSEKQPASVPERGVVHHFQLLAALSKGDADAARVALVEDIQDAAAWYREIIFETDPTPSIAAHIQPATPKETP